MHFRSIKYIAQSRNSGKLKAPKCLISSPGGCLYRPQLTASDTVEAGYLGETVESLQKRGSSQKRGLGKEAAESELPMRSRGCGS